MSYLSFLKFKGLCIWAPPRYCLGHANPQKVSHDRFGQCTVDIYMDEVLKAKFHPHVSYTVYVQIS